MDNISNNKLNTKEKNSASKQPVLITIMRGVFSIVHKILSKICLFLIFIFLFLIHKPIIILTQFTAGEAY